MGSRLLCLCCVLYALTIDASVALSAEQTIQISGTIVDPEGNPVANALVIDYRMLPGAGAPDSHRCRTDKDGKYAFPRLDVDNGKFLYIKVFAPPFAVHIEKVDIAGGDSRTLDFRLEPSQQVRLRVVDQTQQPVSDAKLTLLRSNDAGSFWISRDDWESFGLPLPVSDQQGWLTIPNQVPGRPLDLEIDHPDFVYCKLQGVSAGSDPQVATMQRGNKVQFQVSCPSDPDAVSQATIRITVSGRPKSYRLAIPVDKAGKAVATLADRRTTIRIVHPKLYGLPWYFYRPNEHRIVKFSLHQTGKVRGRVVDQASGEGVAGLRVQLVREQRVIETAISDREGWYEAEAPDVDFQVSVSSNADWIADRQTLPIKVAAGETQSLKDLFVSSKPPIRGRVVTPTGEPVANAIVIAGFRDLTTMADEEGRFSLQPRDDRSVMIQALHPYERLSNVVVAKPGDQELEIVLDTEGYLLGMVVDEAGQPLGGIPVGLQARVDFGNLGTSTIFHRTQSRPDGTFRFLGLTSGMTYQPQVKGKELASYSSGEIVRGNAKDVRDPRDRKPLKVHAKLLKEVQEIAAAEEQWQPDKLLPLDCSVWIGSKPPKPEDFRGKAVLICFGMSPSSLELCEIAHKLYADQGLIVVAVFGGPGPFSTEQLEEMVGGLNISFPVGFDDGATAAKYRPRYSSEIMLFGFDGKFQHRMNRELHALRKYMLYEKLADKPPAR